MALVALNPAFNSFHGRVGRLVFVHRHGRQYVRPYVKPRNPNTFAQRVRRHSFADAVRAWRSLPDDRKMLWNTKARRTRSNGYNGFISWYMRKGGRGEGNGGYPVSPTSPGSHANYISKPGTFVSSRTCHLFRDITAPFQALSIIYPGSDTRLQRGGWT